MKSKPFKIFTILTAALSSATALVAPLHEANAELVIPRDVTYWSFQEMLDFEADFDARANERCGQDFQCIRNYMFEEMQVPGQEVKYSLIDYIKNNHFTITAINPTTETVRLYYRSQENLMDYSGTNNHYQLDELYLAWVEESVPDPRMNVRFVDDRLVTDYVLDVRNGVTTPGVHYVLSGTSAEHGAGWFTPNVELEFSVAGSDLASDPRHWMHFVVLGDRGGNMLGMTEYDTCFNADYREGMECRVMHDSDGRVVYLPFWPDGTPGYGYREPEEPTTSDTGVSDDTTSDASATSDVASNGNNTSDTVSPIITASTITVTLPPSTNIIRVPVNPINQGKSESSTALSSAQDGSLVATASTAKSQEEHVELPLASGPAKTTEFQFPWWIVVLLIGGDALVLWWFLSSRAKKH